MKKDLYPDRTVCSLQLELKNKYKKLSKICDNNEALALVNEMAGISKSIHYKATRMEKRLLKYRQSIEKLGFKRIER